MKSIFALLLLSLFGLDVSAQKALFVDDNGLNAANSDTMISALNSCAKNALGITAFDRWNIKDSGGIAPTNLQMTKYDIVIWYCSTDGVGLRIWNESTAGNPALVSYIQSGKPLWVIGQDILYDQYVAPSTFKSGEFAYDYLGLSSYDVQSYMNDAGKGVPQLERLNWSAASASFPASIKWTFAELWYVDGCTPRLGTFEMYKMGPVGYALEGAVPMFHNLSSTNKISVMSSLFDVALIDSYKNRRDFMGTGIKYLLTKTSGVLNQNAGQDFVIVPNPSGDGLVTITGLSPFSTVLVYDALGCILLNRNISDTTSCKIPLEGLSKGIYYVRVTADNGQWSCRPLCIH